MSNSRHNPQRHRDNNIFGAAPPQKDERSSVRLHQQPGGRMSHNIFGGGDPEPAASRRTGRARPQQQQQQQPAAAPAQAQAAPAPAPAPAAAPAPAPAGASVRGLYPATEPFDSGMLRVSPVHTVYYEQVGNPHGKPAVVLHGGPGGGCANYYRQYFNPEVYRVVLFDQRGSGRSVPHADLRENTTWDLVADIERLREKLGIDRWVVFGGSWGSTLALSYAQEHPQRVKGLLLRGIFTLRAKELRFFYQEGASFLFPEAWDNFVAAIPPPERHNLMAAYHRRLSAPPGDAAVEADRMRCARAWTTWEMATSRLYVDPDSLAKGEDDKFALAFARIESHYFANAGFFAYDGQLLDRASTVLRRNRIPGVIVQGRYDVVCPATTAWELFKNWDDGEGLVQYTVVPDAGHSMKEPGILSELVKACDRYAEL